MKIPVGGIAFLDSGVGGLTVLECCQKRFLGERFYYLGDNARAPYGNLPPELIRCYVHESFEIFERLRAKAVVLACNTVTALCVDELREKYRVPIIGAEPAVAPAAKRGGEIFILTTRATFNSSRFHALCKRVCERYPKARLKAYSCDGLAGGIEEHLGDGFYDFTRFLPRGTPDAVVLGCTHYLYIKERIKDFYGCEVFDGNEGISRRLERCLLEPNSAKNLVGLSDKGGAFEKNRDEQPPFEKVREKIGIFNHFLPRKMKKILMQTNTNKCSCIKTQKSLIIKGVATKNDIYFLGSGAVKNRHFYERLFTF